MLLMLGLVWGSAGAADEERERKKRIKSDTWKDSSACVEGSILRF